MGAGYGLRRHISCVPVVLMSRVQDAAEVWLDGRANQRATIHHGGNFFEALADPHVADGGVYGGECAKHFRDGQAGAKGLIVFWVECVRSGHATAHPQEDAGVCGGNGLSGLGDFGVSDAAWSTCSEGSCGSGGHGSQKVASSLLFVLIRTHDFSPAGFLEVCESWDSSRPFGGMPPGWESVDGSEFPENRQFEGRILLENG